MINLMSMKKEKKKGAEKGGEKKQKVPPGIIRLQKGTYANVCVGFESDFVILS